MYKLLCLTSLVLLSSCGMYSLKPMEKKMIKQISCVEGYLLLEVRTEKCT